MPGHSESAHYGELIRRRKTHHWMGSHHDRLGSGDAGYTDTQLYATWRLSSDPGIVTGLLPGDGEQRGYRYRQGVLQSCEA